MSDNIELNPGSGGAVAATDNVGGVHFQRVKLDLGGDGVSAPVAGSLPVSGDFYQATQPVSAAALPLPAGAATDSTLQALQALNDTMLYMLGAILEKMPRVTGNDQAAVSIEAGAVSFNANQVIGTLSNITSIGAKHASGVTDSISQLGALHLYQNIVVTA